MKTRTSLPPTTSASSTSTSGSDSESRALDLRLDRTASSSVLPTKKRASARFQRHGPTGGRESCLTVIAPVRPPVTRPRRVPGRGRSGSRDGPGAGSPRAPAAPRVGGPAALHQRASEAEQRVVAGRRDLDAGGELGGRLLEPARAEVGTAERLADRGLVRAPAARPCESGTVGLGEVARLEQMPCRAGTGRTRPPCVLSVGRRSGGLGVSQLGDVADLDERLEPLGQAAAVALVDGELEVEPRPARRGASARSAARRRRRGGAGTARSRAGASRAGRRPGARSGGS